MLDPNKAEIHVDEGNQHKGSGGFRPLAKYIGAFGEPNNRKKEAIKMTAPVVTQSANEGKGEKVAMTAPVVTQEGASGGYWMQFIMPSKWTIDTLPEPLDENVKLKEIPERYVASLFFSGRTNENVVEKMEKKLLDSLKEDGLEVKTGCKPVLARYNDPFTPGFFRTNEIWVQINQPDKYKT